MDIASKARAYMGCTSYRKYKTDKLIISKLVVMILIQLLVVMLSSTRVFADGAPDTDIGWGYDSDATATAKDYGYNYWAGGYRTYMVAEGGGVISSVVDIRFIEPESPGSTRFFYESTLGKEASANFLYQVFESAIPGLRPPFYNYSAWGPNLDAWFESMNNSAVGQGVFSNAECWISTVFGAVDGNWEDLLYQYDNGDACIVVEGLYWYRPVAKNQSYFINNGSTGWVYGTTKNIALWSAGKANLLSETPYYGGGPWLGVYTNSSFATALTLIENDNKYTGYKAPSGEGHNSSGEGGIFTYSDLDQSQQGYNMHIIFREKVQEKWYTYMTPTGVTGGSPGPAPEMPPLNGQTDERIRPVTVIKYYELINHKNGKVEYENAGGPFKETKICRTIEVQEEPGWDLVEHFQQTSEQMPSLWNDLKVPKFKRKFSATTVEVTEPNKVLYVLFRKEGTTIEEEEDPEGVEMILTESEISKAYITDEVKDNTDPVFEFNWSKPQEYSGECYHTEDQYEDREVPDPKPWDPNHTTTERVKVADGQSFDHTTNWTDKDLNLVLKLDDSKFNQYKYIMGTVDPFKTILNDENENYKAKIDDASGLTSKKLEDFSAKFVVWRGDDQPTITAYKASPGDSGQVDSLLDKTSADNKDQGKRKDSTDVKPEDRYYEKNLSIFFKIDSGDYTIGTSCQLGRHSDTVNVLDFTGADLNYEFKGPVTVNYFNGDPSEVVSKIKQPPAPQSSSSTGQITTAGGAQWRRQPAYDEMTFYPYVQMSYQTTDKAGTTDGGIVYVMGSYERGFKAGAALKINWKVATYPGTGYSMLLRSDQWSTHATAIEKYGKNILLPGGAIYQLTSNGGAGVGQLGLTMTFEAWYPDIDTKYEDGITSKDGDWNGSNGASEFSALIGSAISSLSANARIEMRVVSGKEDSALNGAIVKPGVDLSQISTSGLKASTETKYYLKSEDASAADSIRMAVGGSGGLAATYNVEAFPDGKVTISGGNTLAKNQGADSINSNQAAGKADAYTSEIQNFISQLQRNAGADKDTTFGNYWAKEDGTWYNESFGVKVNYYKGTITMAVPSNDGIGLGGVTAVLDPNLCPAHASTATRFQSVNTAQFVVTLKDLRLGTFGNTTITFPGYSGYLMASQPFYIADFTVQDND